jgi:N-acetyl-alpha-D-glucosaminyl L-malate synthase BshA
MERSLNVGIVCYASVGGSGVVATELGKALALRCHQVLFVSTETPFRLGEFQEGLSFHQVLTPTYPLFREPQYLLSLANRIVQVSREFKLDIIHAHYAVPHATAAFLSQQVLAAAGNGPAPKVVTTLHGTDITLVGNDSSYSQIVAFSIQQSDSVTAVSASLRDATYETLGITRGIQVIPNFLDCSVHRRRPRADLRRRFTDGDEQAKIVAHISNFRPVKRVDAVVDIFDRIRQKIPARLLLVGDGPDLQLAYRKARELGITSLVHGVGAQEEVVPLLSVADVFLLPSAQESFGLAALEAMACEVPVIASRVGGLPEVIEHGVSGYLHQMDAVDDMAHSALAILTNDELHARIGSAACRRVREHFCVERVVPMYEACYRAVM